MDTNPPVLQVRTQVIQPVRTTEGLGEVEQGVSGTAVKSSRN